MNFQEQKKQQLGIFSVGDKIRSGHVKHKQQPELFIHGPDEFDCLTEKWSRKEYLGLLGGSSSGKCLAKDTPVLMFDGIIKKVQDIKIGEQLMGPDSKPRNVLSLATGRETMYLITPNKGESYTVNESHILSLKMSERGGGYKQGDIVNISIKDYLNQSQKFKTNAKGYRVGVEFPEKELKIEPYFLGIWLGDGSKDGLQICTMDNEVVDYMYDYSERTNLKYSINTKITKYEQKNNKSSYYRLASGKKNSDRTFYYEFKSLNLLFNKHIPSDYLINSRENRLQLLAGILDSDGYKCNDHNFEITQKDENLSNQIVFLARSLGFAAYIRQTEKECVNNGKWGIYYRVFISGNLSLIPMKVERRKCKDIEFRRDVLITGITVTKQKEDEYFGFTIDGDHLFLLGDFTVTHNTALVLYFFKQILENSKDPNAAVAFVSLEMTEDSVAKRWVKLVGENSPLTDKLYVIGQYDHEGKPRLLTTAGILNECKKIKNGLGLDILSVAIDHLHKIEDAVPNENINKKCASVKYMSVELNSFFILLSQVPKGKAGSYSDLPLYRDDSFGNSGFAWEASYVISIHQPLKRVAREAKLNILAWSYVKVREATSKDRAVENVFKLMYYDLVTGIPREVTRDERNKFNQYINIVHERREEDGKKKALTADYDGLEDFSENSDLSSLELK